ncbi:putative F-box domain, leucine-rich repeat domain superfamily, F-box-like domain superfamily [Helianthus annuus]|nr:putative F-box domain, leucine-rich repeat domain superfamily, F-box-like domain superfamily [Helianthus annuus]KAJ0814851.1 putative F-box domain, leucine-rich repeat domain superfamily, F-box-like domain superfamily [Helianthus annuus]KAJ0828071.1 putative F-box domain, leucine-rich repeat domain superfamily, F-box-like domain superfamily [Helianthus annuus]
MSSKNVDRLSGLPDDIISHILSLMATKFAVRTSVLSKRWRYSWKLITNLDFNYTPTILGVSSFVGFVDHVMELCKTRQLQSFRIHFSSCSVQNSKVSNWIDQAVRLNVHELDIHVIKQLELPLSLFTCETLTKLRLDSTVWKCPCQVTLPCLKTLDIIVYTNPLVSAFKLISGCPVLESLYLKVGYVGFVHYTFNIPTLKRLKLTLLCSSDINEVIIDVPNLEYLFVGGIMCSVFVMKNVLSLVEASISVHGLSVHLWDELLKGISGVKSLSIKTMPTNLLLPIFPNMEHLELKSLWSSTLILEFLENSPKLKHLHINKVLELFVCKVY